MPPGDPRDEAIALVDPRWPDQVDRVEAVAVSAHEGLEGAPAEERLGPLGAAFGILALGGVGLVAHRMLRRPEHRPLHDDRSLR